MGFYLENTHSHSFKIHKISIDETERELETTHSDCSAEDHNISIKLIERVASYIATLLTVIINNFNPEENIFRHAQNCKNNSNTKNAYARTTFRLDTNICIISIVKNMREIKFEADC